MNNLEEKVKSLSNQPGCYIFKDKNGRIIYIGKAKDLKKRVSSYFLKNRDYKTANLVLDISDLDFIITDNEIEALLLEAKLIKENQPKYNLELKGGIRYAYIRITDEKFPRLETVRLFKKTDKVFGPFAIAQTRKDLIRLANNLFKLRSGKVKPVKFGDKYKIRLTTSPWSRLVNQEEYKKDILKAELLLKGKMRNLILTLEEEMKSYSTQNNFELAKIRRDQISALKNLAEEQKVQLDKSYDQDVINFVQIDKKYVVQVFNINKGVVSGKKDFSFEIKGYESSVDFLSDFIKQYYYSHEIPQEVLIPSDFGEKDLIEKYLEKLAGRKVKLFVPQKGDKSKLLELVKKNIIAKTKHGLISLLEIQASLNLANLPAVIECFDVSNLGSKYIVASMVYFKDGQPVKGNYRKFKIKWQSQQSDFDAMKEVVYRRYARLKQEGKSMPDLILIDGGKPQLSAAQLVLNKLWLDLPLAALAKKEEEIFVPGKAESIKLDKRSEGLKLLQRVRNEAHRFAITYNRQLRSNSLKKR